ncbi:MAG: MoxR family ATPase [Saprospiraceae bacterium]|nr:MoxR family ATPase [Saprospiraceae bacterium]MBK8633511.1 MoxR family ATPase [Saprospiraceae bacterium]MBP7641770.1 MoxR family ATPase [Saprospiraceae bacterium]
MDEIENNVDDQIFDLPAETTFVSDIYERIKSELSKVIIGQETAVSYIVVALFADGHILLEGVPGIAKTMIAKMITQTTKTDFSRIQFTPDLMPSDILGASVFNVKTSEFNFKKGPIFSNLILIDEINRAPAKTQAALFEVMEERQISIEGETFKFDYPFIVVATQNPIEHEGTYRLPEAQLDRFLMKIVLDYPSLDEEINILQRYKSDFDQTAMQSVMPVVSTEELLMCKQKVEEVHISDELIKYIASLVNATRNNTDLYLGASPRASLAILKTAKAMAALNGRNFVIPDDIRSVTIPVLNHRIILKPEREMEGYQPSDAIQDIIYKTEVPL